MKKLNIIAFTSLLTLMIGMMINKTQVKAATNEEDITISNQAIGGMSLLISSYYDDVLSESGISISNAATTFSIDGAIMKKVDRVSPMFANLAVANVNDYVNIRSSASTDGEVVGRLYAKAVATVTGTEGEWTKITSNGIDGYIKTEYLYLDEKAQSFIEENYTKYAIATCTTLNIREGAGTDYDRIDTAALGDQLKILEEDDEWVKISCDNGTGYVYKSYVDYSYDLKFATTMEEAKKLDEQKKYEASNMIWPLPSDHTIHTYFGYRVAPTKGASTYHKGLDIGGKKGANVVAVLSGTVVQASYSSSSGYYVEIDHGNGLRTRYLHNSKLLVTKGQKVTQGDVISLCGSTGISTGAHLHFSVIKNGSYVDPYPYLKNVH